MDDRPSLDTDDAADVARLQAKLRKGMDSLDRGEGSSLEQAFDELDDYIDELSKRRERQDAA